MRISPRRSKAASRKRLNWMQSFPSLRAGWLKQRRNWTSKKKNKNCCHEPLVRLLKASVDKAKIDALETLGQVVVLKALMDESSQSRNQFGIRAPSQKVRQVAPTLLPLTESLRSLGMSNKARKSAKLTGEMAFSTGIVLLIEGMASRLAAEAWASSKMKTGSVVECKIGLTNDYTIEDIIVLRPSQLLS